MGITDSWWFYIVMVLILAGLKPQDVVLRLDETPIRNENHLINLITATPAGQKVRLQVWRDKRTVSLDAVVGDWAKGQGRFKPAP